VISASKYSLATLAAVLGGASGGSSGETLRVASREDGGGGVDTLCTELARRGGATPLTDWRLWVETLRSRAGEEEREPEEDSRRVSAVVKLAPLAEGVRDKGPRELAALGDRFTAGLKGVGGFDARRGDLGGELGRMDRFSNVCDRLAASLLLLPLFVDDAPVAEDGCCAVSDAIAMD
jgi:hypothetical protein